VFVFSHHEKTSLSLSVIIPASYSLEQKAQIKNELTEIKNDLAEIQNISGYELEPSEKQIIKQKIKNRELIPA